MAERAICTFKNHFIRCLCSVDKNFPLHLWCRLLDQAELTLNMLCTSRINPNLSAHEQLHSIHDFNATPLAPLGTRCIAHEKSSQCGKWAPHGQHGWYMGAAPEHYRCYQIYIPKTHGTRICDTVEFFPTHCKMPKVSSHDAAIYAANDLITVLTKPQPTNSFISIRDDQLVALCQLPTISRAPSRKNQFQIRGCQILHPPPPPPPPPPQRPRICSQTKTLANSALTAPQCTMLFQTQPQPTDEPKQEEDLVPDPLYDIQHNHKPRIIPIIENLHP